jgi:DNA-binding response OmpR family regulator
MAASGQAVDRNQLLSVVWNEEGNSSNIVDVYIGRLRRKLGDYIISVRGIGYKFQGK